MAVWDGVAYLSSPASSRKGKIPFYVFGAGAGADDILADEKGVRSKKK